jgi:hypothetical protein
MALSNSQITQVRQWLAGQCLVMHCPMCGHIAWEFADLMLGSSTLEGDGAQARPQLAHPTDRLVCTNCGYVMLLSARVLGLASDNGGKHKD